VQNSLFFFILTGQSQNEMSAEVAAEVVISPSAIMAEIAANNVTADVAAYVAELNNQIAALVAELNNNQQPVSSNVISQSVIPIDATASSDAITNTLRIAAVAATTDETAGAADDNAGACCIILLILA
jgi:hypothetical protein